jgi:hypothetical protein
MQQIFQKWKWDENIDTLRKKKKLREFDDSRATSQEIVKKILQTETQYFKST